MSINTISNKQIVTVAVITYHSAATVLETLNSIVNQSYGPENIELIISDDDSKDNTVLVVNGWLVQHQEKFYRVKFFANEVNSGISRNCNVAWKAATSEWIKTIAGDDILLPNCLTDNVEFILDHKNENITVLFSKMQSFKVAKDGLKQYLEILPMAPSQKFFKLSALKQFHYLQRQGISGAPSAFINRAELSSVGFADERFPMIEDYPLWFKFSNRCTRLHFMDVVTVYYRISDSISNSTSRLLNYDFINEIINIEEQLVIPTLKPSQFVLKFRKRVWPKLAIQVAILFDNKVNSISKCARALVFIFKPSFLSLKIKNMLNSFIRP